MSLLSNPDPAERKRRGSVLTSARTPPKTARFHTPSLWAPLSNGVLPSGGQVLQVQRIPECFTAVIVDPHTQKSKIPLHTLSLMNSGSPPSRGEPLFEKNRSSRIPAIGLGSHTRRVELGSKNNSTRPLTSVRSQATSLQRYYSNFCLGQQSSFSLTGSANIACKRCGGDSAPSEQRVRLFQPLLPCPKKRWRAQTRGLLPDPSPTGPEILSDIGSGSG